MGARLATARRWGSKASRNPLAIAGLAFAFGLLVASIHYWSVSYVAGWTSPGSTVKGTTPQPQQTSLRLNPICGGAMVWVPARHECDWRQVSWDGSVSHFYFPPNAPSCPLGYNSTGYLGAGTGDLSRVGRSDECIMPAVQGVPDRVVPAEDHPPTFARPPDVGDGQLAAVTALIAYFLVVALIVSGRAIRGTVSVGEDHSHSVAQTPTYRPRDAVDAASPDRPWRMIGRRPHFLVSLAPMSALRRMIRRLPIWFVLVGFAAVIGLVTIFGNNNQVRDYLTQAGFTHIGDVQVSAPSKAYGQINVDVATTDQAYALRVCEALVGRFTANDRPLAVYVFFDPNRDISGGFTNKPQCSLER